MSDEETAEQLSGEMLRLILTRLDEIGSNVSRLETKLARVEQRLDFPDPVSRTDPSTGAKHGVWEMFGLGDHS
ncbi:MAG: hypothetical protein ABIO70_29075 [Pseudomonadota bacterium]